MEWIPLHRTEGMAAAVAVPFQDEAKPATWKSISLTRQLVFEGGFQNKSYRLDTMDVATQVGVDSFVKINKSMEWLLKASVGKTAHKGSLTRTKLFGTLNAKLISAAADSASDSQGSATDDPMSALAEITSAPKKRTRYYTSKRGKDNVIEVTMPLFEPTAHPGDERQRVVRLRATSTTCLWISEGDVEWLVTWLADEYRTGGVPLDDPAVAGEEAQGNCAAPGVRIVWDFSGAWDATILEGELKGKTVKSFVKSLTLEKWTAVDEVHHYGTDFESATREQLKQATFHFLELQMQTLLG